MAHNQVGRSFIAAALFQTIYQFIVLALSRNGSSTTRLTDRPALEAFSQLNEDQLRDIGVCRKLRRRKWDLFHRSFPSECKPVFDYFRVDD